MFELYFKSIVLLVFLFSGQRLHGSGMQYDVTAGLSDPASIWITNFTMDLQVPNQFKNTVGPLGHVFIWPGLGTNGFYNSGYPSGKDIVGGGVLQPVLTYGQLWPNPNNAIVPGWWISGQAVEYQESVYKDFIVGTGEGVGWTGGNVLPVNQGDILHVGMTLKPGNWTQSISDATKGTSVPAWPFNLSETPALVGQSLAELSAAESGNAVQQKQNLAIIFIEDVLGPPVNAATFTNIKIYTNIPNPNFCADMMAESLTEYYHASCTGATYFPSQQYGQSYCLIKQCIVYADPVLILPGLDPTATYALSYDAGAGKTKCRASVSSTQSDNSLLIPYYEGLGCDAQYHPTESPPVRAIKRIWLKAADYTVEYDSIQFDPATGLYTGVGISGVVTGTCY
ncbi:MAG: hypothetical protein WCK49_01515 [Myxococcaceae bacterium]